MKNVMILGGLGNMGRRYACVLRSIGVNPMPIDKKDGSLLGIEEAVKKADGIIIATPTECHAADILDLSDLGIPILVEKPIHDGMFTVEHCVKECQKNRTPLVMINQYKHLVDNRDTGLTIYNYWNHGRDGLAWDCISVVALAKSEVILHESSPIWVCRINGRLLDQAKMDVAYVSMITNWVKNPEADYDYIVEAHEKVHAYLKGQK